MRGGQRLSKLYTTKQGDTFESIAYFELSNSNKMVDIIRVNRRYMNVAVFEAGIVLQLPEESEEEKTTEGSTVPWR